MKIDEIRVAGEAWLVTISGTVRDTDSEMRLISFPKKPRIGLTAWTDANDRTGHSPSCSLVTDTF